MRTQRELLISGIGGELALDPRPFEYFVVASKVSNSVARAERA
jgi:hypothetical protein